MTSNDTERLIRHPVRGLVDYQADAVTKIYRLTSGQPFYTQVICQNLIDHLNEVRQRTIDAADVSTIVDGIVDNPLPQMIYFWDSLPAEEKLALSLLAETVDDESSWESADRLIADATTKGVSVPMGVAGVQSALERLFEKELLTKSLDRRFQYPYRSAAALDSSHALHLAGRQRSGKRPECMSHLSSRVTRI